jgi:hypothetical protein
MAKHGPDQSWREHVLNNILPKMEAGPTTLPAAPLDAPQPFSLPMTPSSFDVIETLPLLAQDRLRKLRLRAADAHALCVPHADIREASTAKVTAENRLRELTAHPHQHGFGLPETDSRVVAQQRLVNQAVDDFRRLQERSDDRAAAWHAASGALQTAETYLRHGRPGGTAFEVIDVEVPKPAKGEGGLLDQIENRRRRVRELRSDLHRIASAPYPSAFCKQRLREAIETLAQRGTPDVSVSNHSPY